MIDLEQPMRTLIDEFLAGKLLFEEFESRYSHYYLDVLPGDVLNADRYELFGSVHERLEWTDVDPDLASRNDGYINRMEFIEWLREFRANSYA